MSAPRRTPSRRPSRPKARRAAFVAAAALVAALVAVPSALGSAWLPWTPAAHEVGAAQPLKAVPPDDPARGMVHRGLAVARKGSACVGEFEVVGTGRCSHGPDEAPPGLSVKRPVAPVAPPAPAAKLPARAAAAAPADTAIVPGSAAGGVALLANAAPVVGPHGVVCDGDGTTGKRVQVLYVRAAGTASRFDQYLPSFRSWAAGVDTIYDASAQETGGHRHLRYVTTADCEVDVREVEVPAGQLDDFGKTTSALSKLGYNRTDRKYMIFGESSVYCGIGTYLGDDKASASNRSNSGPSYGRSDTGCWAASVAAHELGHNLGAVADSAPNSSKAGHCVDDYDVMCYKDTATTVVKIVCTNRAEEQRLDCNHDDYYNTSPAPGSYLATHWNVANNQFLIADDPAGGTPNPTTPAPTPTQPSPTQPGPTQPGPTQPGPTQPGPTQPGPTHPTPTQPGPTQPGPTHPSPVPPGPTPPGGLAPLTVTAVTPTSARLSWPPAAAGSRYGVVVDGRTLGTVRSAGVAIVGFTPDTMYRLRVTLGGAPYTAEVQLHTPAVAAPADGAWFTLTNALAGTAADLYGSRAAGGTPLVASGATGAADQQWRLDGGRLTSKATGGCVAPRGGVTAGAVLVQVPCAGAPAWRLTRTPGGLSLGLGGLVAGLGGSTFDGQRLLVLQRPSGARHQLWTVS
jgi:Ricin-type beta-trefoil lectin domain-like